MLSKYVALLTVLMFGFSAWAEEASRGTVVYKTLIVETVHPFSVFSYSPPIAYKAVVRGGGDSLEGVFFEFVSSLKAADYEWNNSLWDVNSLAEMKQRDAERGWGKVFWESKWKTQALAIYTLLNKIDYGRFSIVEFEVELNGRKSRDTLVFEKRAGVWKATQALSASPLLSNWNNSRGRVQVAPDVLFSK